MALLFDLSLRARFLKKAEHFAELEKVLNHCLIDAHLSSNAMEEFKLATFVLRKVQTHISMELPSIEKLVEAVISRML